MQIDNMMINSGPSVYYSHNFHAVLEDHMTYLRTHETSRFHNIDPMLAYRCDGDLFIYLTENNIPQHLHWIIMRMNNMFSPHDFNTEMQLLIIPDESTVDMIRQSHMSTRSMNA